MTTPFEHWNSRCTRSLSGDSGPAESAKEVGHPLHVAARESQEVRLRRERHAHVGQRGGRDSPASASQSSRGGVKTSITIAPWSPARTEWCIPPGMHHVPP